MILVAGALFLIMGLLSGLFLVLAPLAAMPFHPGIITWVLFPGLTILGYIFVLLPLRTSMVNIISRATGGALLLLAVIATIGIFLLANSMIVSTGSTAQLWYVLGVGLVLGTTGLSFSVADKA